MPAQSPQDVDSVCGERLVMHNASFFFPEISPQPYHACPENRERTACPWHDYPHDRSRRNNKASCTAFWLVIAGESLATVATEGTHCSHEFLESFAAPKCASNDTRGRLRLADFCLA